MCLLYLDIFEDLHELLETSFYLHLTSPHLDIFMDTTVTWNIDVNNPFTSDRIGSPDTSFT